MIDPSNITNYKMTDAELEENILFWVCAAGKNAITSAKGLESLLNTMERHLCYRSRAPFACIREYSSMWDKRAFPELLKSHGIGCYNNKSKTMTELAYSHIDLRNCTVGDLECIKGIGPKTARCFLIHSRTDAKHAGLDTHILKFLTDMGYIVPASTPTGKKYRQIEELFLKIADASGVGVSAFDLLIWNIYSGKDGFPARAYFVQEMKHKYKEHYRNAA